MNFEMLENGSTVCLDDPGEPSTGVKRISVTEQEATLLACLARGILVLEIGTGLGVSTRALASHADQVLTLDTDPWVWEHVWPTLPSNVKTKTRQWINLVGKFDMVFIDGEHQTAQLKEDLRLARAVCKRGIIAVHDWKIPEVRAALDETFALIDTHHGLAIGSVGWD